MISVVIPTHNTARTLSQCLQTVCNQTSPFAELVIVDRFSGDGTVRIARQYGARIIKTDANRSIARNMGFGRTSSPAVLFLDSDMMLPPNIVEECENEMATYDALVITE